MLLTKTVMLMVRVKEPYCHRYFSFLCHFIDLYRHVSQKHEKWTEGFARTPLVVHLLLERG